MHFPLDLICFYIYLLQVIFVAAVTVRTGHFKVSRRSPEIIQCASKHLSTRVSESNGQCERLSGSWDEEKMKPGYEYAKITSEKESFQPPKSLENEISELILDWSVAITSSTRLSLYVTWLKETWLMYTIFMKTFIPSRYFKIKVRLDGYTLGNGRNNYIILSLQDNQKLLSLTEPVEGGEFVEYEDNLPGTECNVTFAASRNNTIQVLFNETSMATRETQIVHLDQLERMWIFYRQYNPTRLFRFLIHGFEVIQG